MMSSLETKYIKPTRPYSQDELKDNRDKLYKKYNISQIRSTHPKCKHFYNVKKNGRKYNLIIESNTEDCGNCSVCWKLHRTPKYLKEAAYDLISEYERIFYNDPTYLSYDMIDLEKAYYKWLFEDFSS